MSEQDTNENEVAPAQPEEKRVMIYALVKFKIPQEGTIQFGARDVEHGRELATQMLGDREGFELLDVYLESDLILKNQADAQAILEHAEPEPGQALN